MARSRLVLAVVGGLFVHCFGLWFLSMPDGGASAAPGSAPPLATGRIDGSFPGPIGLQLYSLRNQLARDVPGTLNLVKGFGFRQVELAGTYGSPRQVRAQLDSRGLKQQRTFPFERLSTDVEESRATRRSGWTTSAAPGFRMTTRSPSTRRRAARQSPSFKRLARRWRSTV